MDRAKEQIKEHRQRVIHYYDVAQPFYQRLWHGSSLGLHYGFWEGAVSNRYQAILKENEVLADLAKIKSGEVVLDAGCGIGGSGIWLARERKAKVYGLNLVRSQLKIAQDLVTKRGLIPDLGFLQGDYQQLPVGDSSVDVFWSLESIEHATDPIKVITEAYRVLKPQGRAVIAGTFKGRYDLTNLELGQLDVGMRVAGCFNDLRTANELGEVMKDSSFVDVINFNKTNEIMESARQMTRMCKIGLPIARVLTALHLVSPVLVLNNQWGTYQEGLFKSGATSYNVLVASKP